MSAAKNKKARRISRRARRAARAVWQSSALTPR